MAWGGMPVPSIRKIPDQRGVFYDIIQNLSNSPAETSRVIATENVGQLMQLGTQCFMAT
jgi:hypothetical protein